MSFAKAHRTMKRYEPASDREQAHEILRSLLAQGLVPHTPHPGDWDWWTFHADPRDRAEVFIGPGALAAVTWGREPSEVDVFGLTAEDAIELGRMMLPGVRFNVSHVSLADKARVDALVAAGFELDGPPGPEFERSTAGAVPRTVAGFDIRPLRGEEEHQARADAARLAFASTLAPDVHRARYLDFMRSPAYVAEHDIVAVAPDGTIASFAIHWPDAELSLARFEPVGTHPGFQRRGLAQAVLRTSLARLAASGIDRARVKTGGSNERAQRLYLATGFELVDQIGTFRAPASFES